MVLCYNKSEKRKVQSEKDRKIANICQKPAKKRSKKG
jgi:hypothetical protein